MHHKGRWYSTPLGMATKQGNVKNMKLLIEAGADVNYDTGIYSPMAPLIVAAENGKGSKIKLHLSAGADVNISYDVLFINLVLC